MLKWGEDGRRKAAPGNQFETKTSNGALDPVAWHFITETTDDQWLEAGRRVCICRHMRKWHQMTMIILWPLPLAPLETEKQAAAHAAARRTIPERTLAPDSFFQSAIFTRVGCFLDPKSKNLLVGPMVPRLMAFASASQRVSESVAQILSWLYHHVRSSRAPG